MSSSSPGRAVAWIGLQFSRSPRAEADVALLSRSERDLRTVAEEAEGLGRRSLALPTDLSDEATVLTKGKRHKNVQA